MSERTVYIDFQDGNGFIDISDYVKYDTLTYKLNAFNNTFKYAQNTCSFDVVYDAALYDKFVSATKDTLIRILDVDGNAPILTEAYEEILTEDGVALLVEQQWAEPVFYGHMPLTRAREYNGVIDNTFFSVEATDELDLLDVKIGDIVLTNNTIMASATPSASIVHQLAAIAGWNSSRVFADTHIPTVLAKFAPQSEDDSVLEVLSTLLYEYGYSLSLDAQSRIHPILWNVTSIPSVVAEFNEDNIIDTITIEDDFNQYDGGEVQYCELGQASSVRLFTDSNCPRDDNSDFSGYGILNGYYYPPETNTIDETTGVNQIAYQEYADTAIKYITNYSIRNNLDLNYSAFSSDFSGIVATANHWVDRKSDTGLTITLESFGNKKCQLLYRNTTGSTKKLYYNDVYGDVWFKSSNRTINVDFVANPSNKFSYSMKYVFEKAIADAFIRGIMANYENGCTHYRLVSEERRDAGDIVRVRLDEGTNQLGIISNKSWDEGKELWTYSVVAVYPTKPALSSQDVFTGAVEVVLPIIDSYATANNLTIPYNNGSPDFTNAFVDMHVTRDGIDVSSDWTYSAVVSGLTGAFSPTIPNRYIISAISSASATLDITASRLNWSNQVQHIVVVKGADAAGTNTAIYTYTPKYRGVGLLASGSNATFQSASVSDLGIVTPGADIAANAGDWMLNYNTSTGMLVALYVWSGSAWATSTDVRYMDSCSTDIFNLKIGGIEISGYMTVINAVIKNLMVSQLKLLTGGKLFSGAGNFDNADTPVYMDAAGRMSLGTGLVYDGNSIYFKGAVVQGGLHDVEKGFADKSVDYLQMINGDIITNSIHVDPTKGTSPIYTEIEEVCSTALLDRNIGWVCSYMGKGYVLYAPVLTNEISSIRLCRIVNNAFSFLGAVDIPSNYSIKAIHRVNNVFFSVTVIDATNPTNTYVGGFTITKTTNMMTQVIPFTSVGACSHTLALADYRNNETIPVAPSFYIYTRNNTVVSYGLLSTSGYTSLQSYSVVEDSGVAWKTELVENIYDTYNHGVIIQLGTHVYRHVYETNTLTYIPNHYGIYDSSRNVNVSSCILNPKTRITLSSGVRSVYQIGASVGESDKLLAVVYPRETYVTAPYILSDVQLSASVPGINRYTQCVAVNNTHFLSIRADTRKLTLYRLSGDDYLSWSQRAW